ncbi:hypothetical protein [Alicyclobacillus acidocaldarius]|uniref:Uncharacterized protein n=1 Tax=Alicyclobacillus acidocaldarius subsp. acidocaldarius (strain ATCC 27009 / DSM 446 / BCRC 14685 / JCM 5260 / KCTC 1825 / NBRC 15652 / NCIMB 11725 / NRRL B-14509 / 104-IA) TaxID=521098 RepID=C8WVK0_ALIAD|nr:hypothetical protein [Alicyclobacillus acidocaldarius]ACV58122.1 hypothetical protein Aaci_1086 [Alicyclobacillus acidocaldarius subsp. acidocaldarius DSM 446]MCL6446335.1 hypothetical protein [Alicyclobacillus sp.]
MVEFAVWEQGRVRIKRGMCLGIVEEGEYPPVYEKRVAQMAYDPHQPCKETRLLMAVPKHRKVTVVNTVYLVLPEAVAPWDRTKLRDMLTGEREEEETTCAV